MEKFPNLMQEKSCQRVFPELPPELGRDCLLRVPYIWHNHLRSVSRSWKDVMKSPQFYQDRELFGLWEQCVCLLENSGRVTLYHPHLNMWQSIPPIPTEFRAPICSECVSVKNKLILMGGYVRETFSGFGSVRKPSSAVLLYDFSLSKWLQCTDMPIARVKFACAASPEGLVYISGSVSETRSVEGEAAVYHVEEDKWEILPDMEEPQLRCCGVYLDHKFFVISNDLQPAQVYDVRTRTWTVLQSLLKTSFDGNIVAAFGRLYLFELGHAVMDYDLKENILDRVESIPRRIMYVQCVTLCGEKFFVCGCDYSGNTVFYMYCPPTAKANTTTTEVEKWTAIHGKPGFLGKFYKAATVKI